VTTRITMLGDSLTAGYGLAARDALPVQLQTELVRLGQAVVITNAGVSGDTTADGLRRMDRDVPEGADLCIVALGANDMMLKASPDRVEANLDAILSKLAARGIPAMVCGMRAPPWFGAYAPRFDAVFKTVAEAHDAAFDPFLLEGIALNPLYTLPDRMHPNAAGIQIVARRLAPHVIAALTRSRS
jgi:acyl-CoA thioesterase I